MQRLEAEALRLYRRYEREIVQGLGLCPWAVRARREGHVAERVLLCAEPDVPATVAAVGALGADPKVHIGLLLFPRLVLARHTFQRFVSHVRDEAARQGDLTMAVAAFHPDAEPDPTTPERLVPFLRRTPDPTIQLVRTSVLDQVRGSQPHGTGYFDPATIDLGALMDAKPEVPLHQRVAEANLARVREVGIEHVCALADDIRRDRDRTYAQLLP
jgi:hypothetical protein